MTLKRAAMILAAAGACAAWLSAAMAPPRSRRVPPDAAGPTPIETRGAELASEIARLHDRLRPDATPRQPGRNLFSFGAVGARPVTPVTPVETTATPPARPASPALAQPEMRLVGLAEDTGPDGPVRTAIITSTGQLFLVKEGERVTPLYYVARISADVVELTDIRDGTTRRLALK